MSNLSLTEFVDIASVISSRKISRISKAKNKDDYSPATDFYRPLRDGLTEIHKSGGARDDLDKLKLGLTDKKKIANYPSAIEGYKKWWGRKKLDWFDPVRSIWEAHGISVAVNPEVGVSFGGDPHLIKLYFKADPLSKAKSDIALQLMEQSLRPEVSADTVLAILDIRRSKLIQPTSSFKTLPLALDAELAFVSAVWSQV